MRAAKTPLERLEFGLRWEAYRLAYFSSIGHSTKVAALTAKLQTLEEDLRRESYQFSDECRRRQSAPLSRLRASGLHL